MSKFTTGICCAALLALADSAMAHHSTAHYDFVKPAQASGTVKQFSAKNPHLHLVLAVNDATGPHDVTFEGHSLNFYVRAGYRKGMVNPGDQITINYSPIKGGEAGGYVTAILTAKGGWIRVGAPIQ